MIASVTKRGVAGVNRQRGKGKATLVLSVFPGAGKETPRVEIGGVRKFKKFFRSHTAFSEFERRVGLDLLEAPRKKKKRKRKKSPGETSL